LERAQSEAKRLGGTAVPLSFDPHPAQVLRPDGAPLLLTPPEHKLHLLRGLGFSHALILPFDQAMAATSADNFIESLALAARPLAAICVGQEWAFGKGRHGNLQKLGQLGAQLHFHEIGVPEIQIDGEVVSSTRIRNAVTLGNFSESERLLGRPYSVFGRVQQGRALGRTIGFPTANIALSSQQLPPHGVYAVRVRDVHSGAVYSGVANLGIRPTVDTLSGPPLLEAHLFDFSADLYGNNLEVEFVAHLREERKFASVALLKSQIELDTTQARAVLDRTEAARLS
jgi:riboflavin kinase/FMN adenylyltransferase